ncbi:MAG: PaaI family thioesterase [Paracoccaceae bacterium]
MSDMTGEDAIDRLGRLMRAGATANPDGELLSGLPHSHELGMRLHLAEDGVAILSVPYAERLVGDPQTGVLHGGVVTALLDTACGTAVMAVREKLKATATLDLRIDYMRPATRGLAVFAWAECYRLTRAIGFARAVAYHEDPADPVASAAGAFMLDRPSDRPSRAEGAAP